MQEKLALNIKIPRLGKNRLGVFFVRSSLTDENGKASIAQLSLRTKDSGLAKLLGLKFCIHLAHGGSLTDFRHFLSTYTVDLDRGHIEAQGEDDHLRGMEAQKIALELQEKRLEGQRLAIQLAKIRVEELEAGRLHQKQSSSIGHEVAKIMSELMPDMFDQPDSLSSAETNETFDGNISGVGASKVATQSNQVVQIYRNEPTVFPKKYLFPRKDMVKARPDVLLKQEMNRHLAEEANTDIKAQTIGEKQAVFTDFLTCFGDDAPLNSITRDEVTHRWRNEEYNRENKKDLEMQAKLDAQGTNEKIEIKKLSPGRIEKRRGYMIKFFTWVIDAGTYKHPKTRFHSRCWQMFEALNVNRTRFWEKLKFGNPMNAVDQTKRVRFP